MTGDTLLSDNQLSDNQLSDNQLSDNQLSDNQLSDNQPVQKTLDGQSLSPLPKVRTTDGFIVNWDRNIIVNQLLKETKLSEVFYNKPPITKEEAVEIAREAEKLIRRMNAKFLSGPLIREIVNTILLEKGHVEWRNIMTRVGASVYDAYEIDTGYGFEAKDNANQLNNAETSHKRKADKMSKEQNLLLMPKELADLHLNGDFHIHDLEYMGTRPFCMDGSMVVPVQEAGIRRVLRLDEIPMEQDEYFPESLYALVPTGYRRIQKVTKRPVGSEEILKIKTSSGRSILVTGEHRVPIDSGNFKIKKASEIEVGDLLYPARPGIPLRGTPLNALDLVHELLENVPAEYLENMYAKNLDAVFKGITGSGKAESFTEISRTLNIEHNKQWYSRGIMPLATFAALCKKYGIEYSKHEEVTIGVAGSEHDLPARLELSEELLSLLGFFVSEGNYDVNEKAGSYNLAITENHQSASIAQYAENCLNSFATIYKGGVSDVTTIYGVETERKRAQQVYFGGKLAWLLFRYLFKIPAGSMNKRLPGVIWHVSDEVLKAFLSALFTGDGSAYYRPEKSDCVVNYTTVSPTLRQELSLLLLSLGMEPQVVELYEEEDRKTLYRIQLNGRKNIEIFSKWACFLDERQKHIDRFLGEVKETKVSEKRESVIEIKPVKATGEYVYDIFLKGDGTEESHTFYASDGLLIHNCQDWDLRYFFYYGLMPDGVGTQSSVAKPAKNAEVAFLHAVKAMGSAQTNFAGGQGFYNFLTFMAPYLEGKSYLEIKQLMQMFVYEMMQMMCARGGQTVFSSVQLSPGVPKLWKHIPIVAMGRVWDGKQAPLRIYGEFEKEVRLGFKALMDVMLEGDAWGKPFSFPKPEISLEPDFMKEDEEFNKARPELPTYKELYRMTFELAAKFGTPYFDNQLPEYRGAGEGISCYQCCAYQFSANPTDDAEFSEKLYFKDGKHFSMGSWMVLSLNCPRAAYRAEHDDEKLFSELKSLMNKGVELFKIKRRWMNALIEKNRIPFASQRPKDPNTGKMGAMAVDFDSLVYTIGVVGINEMVQYHTGFQIFESAEAYRLAIRAMFEMKLHAQKLSQEYGMEIALARTPAETTAQRFAVSDLLHREYADKAELTIKGDINAAKRELGCTHDLPVYYTNGTHIPPGADISLVDRLKYEHTFFPIVDGGNIMHIWLGEGKPDPEGLQELAMYIAKNTQVGYFAFTRDMTVCRDGGYVASGLLDRCPKCGSENVEHLSRITGYLQSVEGWNRGKRQELLDRKRYGTRELR